MNHPYAAAVLRSQCTAVMSAPEGTRNAVLNTAALKVGHYVPAYLDQREAVEALMMAGRAAGLEERETDNTVASGLRKGMSEPRVIPSAPLQVVPDRSDDDVSDVRTTFPRLDWHALFNDETEQDWVVEPLIPVGRLVALYSRPKVGKSLLMLELAVAISRGTPVLGTTLDRARRVLYVDHENDPRGDVRTRLEDMGIGPEDLDGLDYLSFPTMAALDSHLGGDQLMATAAAYSSEVIVIDTVSRAVAGEENSNDTWLSFYRHTGLRVKRAGLTLVRLDHSGKNEARGQRGGSAKSGDVDVIWRLSEEIRDQVYKLECEDHRLPIVEKVLTLHRETVPVLRHRVDSMGRVGSWQAKVTAIVDACDAAGLPNDAGRRLVGPVARAAGVSARGQVLDEAVRLRKLRIAGTFDLT